MKEQWAGLRGSVVTRPVCQECEVFNAGKAFALGSGNGRCLTLVNVCSLPRLMLADAVDARSMYTT